jgi:hypothetical protein
MWDSRGHAIAIGLLTSGGTAPPIQAKAMAALSYKGAFRNPKTEMLESIDFSRVLRVRDYVLRHYAS